MAYSLSNIYTKNYRNPTTIVEIIVGGWVVSVFETQWSILPWLHVTKQYLSSQAEFDYWF